MLLQLNIHNLATIQHVEIEFDAGFSILSGETGAGKSIIIDALHFITGKKADYALVRSGETQATVEGIFEISQLENVQTILQEEGIPFESELIIRRVLQSNNRQKIFLNDVAVTRFKLEEIGKLLVNIHGQHDNQALLQTATHIDFLDGYGQLSALRQQVKECFDECQIHTKNYEHFKRQAQARSQQIEELFYQKEEIEQLELQADEEEHLSQEAQILNHAAQLSLIFSQAQEGLYDQDGSIIEHLGIIQQSLQTAEEIDPKCKELRQALENSLFQLEDLRRNVTHFASQYQENPQRLEWVNQRLNQIQNLKRKYGNSIAEILEHLQQIRQTLDQLQNPEESEKALHEKMVQAQKNLQQASQELSKKRHRVRQSLDQKIMEELHQLGMEKAVFQTKLSLKIKAKEGVKTYHYSPLGMDEVEFLLSVNPGQELRSLTKVASGGELSRVMLALKTVLIAVDPVETMVFDEIDAGISGRIAEMVGYKLRSLGKSHQALCVTHLPQIVAFSQNHFVISKTIQQNSTFTTIQTLTFQEKIQEIARLMGGAEVTSQTLGVASEMLERAQEKLQA